MKYKLLIIIFIFVGHYIAAQQSDFEDIDFSKAEERAARYKGENISLLPVLTTKLTAQLHTDIERLRAIYVWIAQNIAADENLVHKNDKMTRKLAKHPQELAQWQRTHKREILRRLLNDKVTVCTGYAHLLKAMAEQAGIPCKVVNGIGLSDKKVIKNPADPNHSWNMVFLNNKWYYCDVTWSTGYSDPSTLEFYFDYDDSYFLMEPAVFNKTHLTIESPNDLK